MSRGLNFDISQQCRQFMLEFNSFHAGDTKVKKRFVCKKIVPGSPMKYVKVLLPGNDLL